MKNFYKKSRFDKLHDSVLNYLPSHNIEAKLFMK